MSAATRTPLTPVQADTAVPNKKRPDHRAGTYHCNHHKCLAHRFESTRGPQGTHGIPNKLAWLCPLFCCNAKAKGSPKSLGQDKLSHRVRSRRFRNPHKLRNIEGLQHWLLQLVMHDVVAGNHATPHRENAVFFAADVMTGSYFEPSKRHHRYPFKKPRAAMTKHSTPGVPIETVGAKQNRKKWLQDAARKLAPVRTSVGVPSHCLSRAYS